jgi:hypothetical protein
LLEFKSLNLFVLFSASSFLDYPNPLYHYLLLFTGFKSEILKKKCRGVGVAVA